jgi:hypothetical protein
MSEKEQEIEIAEIAHTMSSESGRRFIKRILDFTEVDENIFNIDTHIHAKNAGKREVGLWLQRELKQAVPGIYNNMLKEQDG